MAGPSRTTTAQPPRPPNAWILYRSDKLRELPPVPAGMPRRAQSDVSREISQMWKRESELVRQEYERKAEVRKAQHQNAYPGYRYHPVSKAEKERQREEKRAEKDRERKTQKKTRNRPAPYSTILALPKFEPSPYSSDTLYGPCGPSPPLAAAPSPIGLSCVDLPPVFEPQVQQQVPAQREDLPYLPQNALSLSIPGPSSARPHASRVSSHSYAMSPIDARSITGGSPASLPEETPTPTSSLWLPATPSTAEATPGVASGWPDHAADNHTDATPSQDGHRHWSDRSENRERSPDVLGESHHAKPPTVEFEIPSGSGASMQGWAPQFSAEYQESLQALLSGTGDPSIFQLSGIDPSQLIANPGSEIEISFGQTGTNSLDPGFAEMFGSVDMSFLNAPEPNYDEERLPLFAPQPRHAPSTDSVSHSHRPAVIPHSEYFQYLNLDLPVSASQDGPTQQHHQPPVSHRNHSVPPSAPPPHTERQSYVPPAGAAHASRRHVGASWRPSALSMPDSPVERSVSVPWEVPAT